MSAALGDYDFLAPPRILFGWGRRREVGGLAAALAPRRALVVFGSRTLAAADMGREVLDSLAAAGLGTSVVATISREPTVADVDQLVARLRTMAAGAGDVIVAVGGGSAIDLAKAAAALVPGDAQASVVDYLEGVGRGLKIAHAPLPVVAMPTTGGTGAEATKNAVISSLDPPFKKSLRSDLMMPRAALVDPELSVSLPAATTAWTGMDAITQCIESFVSRRARPVPRALAADGLRHAIPSVVRAVREPHARAAREAMAHAALLSGMALANSGLGLAHGVAAALGVTAAVPHGLACAVMLPWALRTNREACGDDFAELAAVVWPQLRGTTAAAADAFLDRVDALCAELRVPRRLRDLGVSQDQVPAIAAGSRGNSMDGNPVALSDAALLRMLEEAW